jgi:hypothetical protein
MKWCGRCTKLQLNSRHCGRGRFLGLRISAATCSMRYHAISFFHENQREPLVVLGSCLFTDAYTQPHGLITTYTVRRTSPLLHRNATVSLPTDIIEHGRLSLASLRKEMLSSSVFVRSAWYVSWSTEQRLSPQRELLPAVRDCVFREIGICEVVQSKVCSVIESGISLPITGPKGGPARMFTALRGRFICSP